MILIHLRLFLPVFALLGWALAAALGVDVAFLRVAGPLVTGVATFIHIRYSVQVHKERLRG